MVDKPETTECSFVSYVRGSRLLKVGLAFSLIYYVTVLSVFVLLTIADTVDTTVYTVDFQVFYEAGRAFLTSPSSIYSVSPNGLPFRYLPAFAAAMALFVSFPLASLYVLDITVMTLLNICLVYVVYKISLKTCVTTETKNFEKTLAIVAITPPQVVNLILGQISQLVILLVLVVLFLLMTSSEYSLFRNTIIGILIGVAITLKPFCIVFLPFLVPVSRKGRFRVSIPIKSLLGISLGFFLTMLPSILYFSVYPMEFIEFMRINLVDGLSSQHSTSVTRLAVALVPFADRNLVQLVTISVIGGYIFVRNYISFVKAPVGRKNYIHHFASMIFLVLLVYPDSWFLFLALWYALLAPAMLQLYDSSRLSKDDEKKLDILWSWSNNLLAFFSVGVLVYYLVLGFDPIIPIWLIVLYFLYQHLSDSADLSVRC